MKERAKRGPKKQQTLRDEEIRAAYKMGATRKELSAWYGLEEGYIGNQICKGVRGF